MRLLLLVLATALLATGCASKTQPAKFYLLQPISASEAGHEPSASRMLIGVGPVEIPAYLDRPQIVTGTGGARLELDEFQRWAEPLRDNFTQVLAENLSRLLPASHILPFPWNRAISPDYQVGVQVLRFHVDASGNGELKANWSLLRQNKPLLMKEFQAKIPATGGDAEARVKAQSRALAQFSQEIARALSGLPADRE